MEMEVWTEYEGRTIDGAFPLTRLLRPEGSSAFFTTSNEAGLPRLIRLIESRSDEEDILSRWRGVAALDHPNILKLEEYGQVVIDETSLVYAVMEPVDANLGEIVRDQRLTLPETRQLAASLSSVLEALHAHGFLHQHVQPVNVVAVGEVVKLQCDCIREAPEGERGRQLKQRDVHDLAVVLLQALTQEQTLEAATSRLPLPAPFDQIVTRGIRGEWGLTQITAALEGTFTPQDTPSAAVSPDARIAARPRSSSPETAEILQPNLFEPASPPDQTQVSEANEVSLNSKDIEMDRFAPLSEANEVLAKAEEIQMDRFAPRIGPMAAVAAGLIALLIVVLTWYLLSRRPTIPANTPKATFAPAADAGAKDSATATSNGRVESPANVAPVAAPIPQDKTASSPDQWRVIAYTYLHEAQADKKAATLAQKYPELQPEVFRPNGDGPYLVTVGGTMGKDEAFALTRRVRHEGLPHDTYAQNYRSSNH
jgi:eukaryotic-like serine/threonine-protein kinase